ncbi:MAG: hypothetical protein IJA20_08240 [Methanocorpusculum sp.]|nr:hypothetical protein [Oscillospiraceae bacterium]MBQ3570641.1 hypothetical protein [Methanocorpusculum sp.]
MQLMKKTPLGTLMARYKRDEEYPGFVVDLFRKGLPSAAVCMVEYEPTHNCIQVVIYGDSETDAPTVIAKIQLPGTRKHEGECTDEK